ncbi:MAG TPA: MG2 domain-containing protein, partial [Myxococcota bacterium]|nr:MG2 domain-containing protein [Myxococcota bacterium]
GIAPRVLLALGLLALGAAPARAEQPRFYLSTDRVFSPGEAEVYVQLEAHDLSELDFRLYRVPDPAAFFRAQPDLHRVETEQGPARAHSLEVAAEAWHQLSRRLWDTGKGSLSKAARVSGRRAYGEQVDGLQQRAEAAPERRTSLGLLKGLEVVDLWQEQLPGGGEWVYPKIPLGVRRPGVYLVEAVNGTEVGYTVVVLSRMLLLTRQSQDRFLVFAADPDLGTPVPEAEVSLWSGGQEIAKGTTDAQGVWEKDVPLLRETVVFARRGEDFALLDPSYHPANLMERKVYLTSERPVYRPGHEVQWKGVVRAWRDERYQVDGAGEQAKLTVRDPNGQAVFEGQATVSERGSFHGAFRLPESASVGTYRLVAALGSQEYAGEFKVKAYRKPEFKVGVRTDKKAYPSGARVQAEVNANYFFGPPLPGAKVKVSAYRTRFYVPWWVDAEYAWYYSESEVRSSLRETIFEGEGRLDEQGKHAFSFETKPDSLDWTYGIEAVVVDAAENTITGRASLRVTKAEFRLVLEPEVLLASPGGQARVRVRTTDFARAPVPAEVEVVVTARRAGAGGQVEEAEVHRQRVATGPKGEAWVSFPAERGGAYQVSGSAKDAGGQPVVGRATLYVTSDGADVPAEPSGLEILADRRTYRVGDKARFLVLSPHAESHLLVTVEGGRLYRHEVLRARGNAAVLEVPIAEAQSPNFFVRAATVFERNLLEQRLDVVVPPREKLLQVAVRAEKSPVRPGEQVSFLVEVRDSDGQPVPRAEVALGVVDEAVYGISPEFAIPIERFFYHRKRDDVRASCSLDFRFYGYGVDRKDRMAALHLRAPVVPGSFKELASAQVRKDFKDTLAWEPALLTDAQGVARLSAVAPDNLTTWRATARVVTGDTRVGEGTGEVRVSKPVVVQLVAPAFLVEGDRSRLGVLVQNYTEAERTFQVRLESGAPGLTLEGQPAALKVAPGGLALATWQASATAPGEVVLRAAADGGDGAEDGVQRTLPILRYGLEQVLVSGGVLDDERPTARLELEVPAAVAEGSVRAEVSLSSGLAPALLSALDYLAGYPYGCTEQTMSRFLPDLVVAKALDELKLPNPALQAKLPEYIHAGLARLKALQHADGGWGWWEGDSTDPMMTAYVVHGLALAKKLGWPLDEDLLARGSNRLQALVRDSSLSPTGRSYLLYSLALAGVKFESMLEKLVASPGELSDYGRALLALALHELGQREPAERLTAQLELAVATDPGDAPWGREDGPGWERDPVESTAAVLRALVLGKPGSARIPEAVRWLMAAREEGHWQSTRDTAMAVFALVDYLKKSGGALVEAQVTGKLNAAPAGQRALGQAELLKPSLELFAAPARAGANLFELERQGKGSVFYTASVRFFGPRVRHSYVRRIPEIG